jgi:hypothetical protein
MNRTSKTDSYESDVPPKAEVETSDTGRDIIHQDNFPKNHFFMRDYLWGDKKKAVRRTHGGTKTRRFHPLDG